MEHPRASLGLRPQLNVSGQVKTYVLDTNVLLHDPRLESLLPRVKAKTLVLWGAGDRVVPVDYGKKFARLIPGAELEVVPECGHLMPFEKPEEFHRAVTGFLG